jgi:chondroitin AC lyase
MPVFNLWIDHGRAPEDETYQYIVIPNASAKQVAKQSASSDFEVLSNTKSIQAVYSRSLRLAEIAFREPGSLSTPLGEVKADHSCLLLVEQIANGWKVTASDPENQPLILNVAVQVKQITIQLPGGLLAGSSVITEVR